MYGGGDQGNKLGRRPFLRKWNSYCQREVPCKQREGYERKISGGKPSTNKDVARGVEQRRVHHAKERDVCWTGGKVGGRHGPLTSMGKIKKGGVATESKGKITGPYENGKKEVDRS